MIEERRRQQEQETYQRILTALDRAPDINWLAPRLLLAVVTLMMVIAALIAMEVIVI